MRRLLGRLQVHRQTDRPARIARSSRSVVSVVASVGRAVANWSVASWSVAIGRSVERSVGRHRSVDVGRSVGRSRSVIGRSMSVGRSVGRSRSVIGQSLRSVGQFDRSTGHNLVLAYQRVIINFRSITWRRVDGLFNYAIANRWQASPALIIFPSPSVACRAC